MKLPPVQVLVFLSMLVVMASGVAFLLDWRLVAALELSPPWSTVGHLAVLAWIGLLLSGMILPRLLGKGPTSDRIAWVGYLALGLLGLVLPLIALRDLGWLAWGLLSGLDAFAGAAVIDRSVHMQQATVGVLLGGIGLLGFGLVAARRTPAVRRVTVPIADLPPALAGLRIVQLSDVHVGPTIGADFLRPVVERVNALNPDLVVITGDLVDGTVADLAAHVAPLADLRAPLGRFFVTGNHEYYAGATAWVEHLRTLGFDVLLNEHRQLRRDGATLVLAGVTDHDAGRIFAAHKSDPAAAFAGAPTDAPRILLAHQPRSALQAQNLDIDLQLSGHTHGGQLWPWMHLVWLQQPTVAGLDRVGDVPVYTSRGTGTWGPPVRVGAPSEISLIELVAS